MRLFRRLLRYAFMILLLAALLFIIVAVRLLTRSEFPNLPDLTPANDQFEFTRVVGDLTRLTYLTHAGDDRLFAVQQTGRIHVIENGRVLETPFLDITENVASASVEQGLLGLAFDPEYATTGNFYVNYVDKNNAITIARYRVSADDPNRADPESFELVLLVETAAGEANQHYGGQLAFGPDGFLYIAIGDRNIKLTLTAQSLDNVKGSLLRIDVQGDAPYSVPEDNPLVGIADARPEIWAYGLRNPWRFSFDRETGALYIADVGLIDREEINYQPPNDPGGQNYGWPFFEGSFEHDVDADIPSDINSPVFEYLRPNVLEELGGNIRTCAVIGGYVYRGTVLPELAGKYIYGDFCAGTVWTLEQTANGWSNELLIQTAFPITSFGEGLDGELYLLTVGGEVWKLVRR